MSFIYLNQGSVIINGKTFGKKVSKISISLDGEILDFPIDDILKIDITSSNVESVTMQSGIVNINGNVGNVKNMSGNINVSGNVSGNVSNVSGNVYGKTVYGKCSSVSGSLSFQQQNC